MNLSTPLSTIVFTGHRHYNRSHDCAIIECLEQLVTSGARVFRVGMAEGFDLAAAFVVLELRNRHPEIRLEAYIPYPEFRSRLSKHNQQLYDAVLNQANEIRYIASEYRHGIYYERNRALVDGADLVVAWWDGSTSGTGQTVRYARKQHVAVKNLFGYQQLELIL